MSIPISQCARAISHSLLMTCCMCAGMDVYFKISSPRSNEWWTNFDLTKIDSSARSFIICSTNKQKKTIHIPSPPISPILTHAQPTNLNDMNETYAYTPPNNIITPPPPPVSLYYFYPISIPISLHYIFSSFFLPPFLSFFLSFFSLFIYIYPILFTYPLYLFLLMFRN